MYLDIAARQFGLLAPLQLIKGQFSRAIEKGERILQSRLKRGERGLWQRRFWEHLIRDDDDFNRLSITSIGIR